MRRCHEKIAAIFLLVFLHQTAIGQPVSIAQDYPRKPIRILASDPGAVIDMTARLLIPGLTASLGQSVIIDNRSSSGFVLPELALKSLPDGYTLLIQSGSFWVATLLQTAPYDPLKDFIPVTLATNAPLFLYTHPSMAAKTLKEFIAFAKSRPGELNYGSAGSGATNFLAFELFKTMAGVNIVRVPYKGTGQAANGLLANQVQAMFGSAAAGMPQVKTGRLRVLAVADAQPSALAPDVPTVAAAGVPGYEAASMSAIWVPAHTPRAIVNRLNGDIVQALRNPFVKEKLSASGIEIVATTPEQAAVYVKSDMAKMAKVIRDAGVKAD